MNSLKELNKKLIKKTKSIIKIQKYFYNPIIRKTLLDENRIEKRGEKTREKRDTRPLKV